MAALQVNFTVLVTTIIIHTTLATLYNFQTCKGRFFKLVFGGRDPTPDYPLRPLLASLFASATLLLVINSLAARFQINIWKEGLQMAAVLWVIDTCHNLRHYMFESRPLALFVLHSGFHAITLALACSLLCAFGTVEPIGGLQPPVGPPAPSAPEGHNEL